MQVLGHNGKTLFNLKTKTFIFPWAAGTFVWT